MALRERVFSLETEYGIQFYPRPRSATPDAVVQVAAIVEAVAETYGTLQTNFLINGSKFHPDMNHPEWSLPECRTAREAATYDKAADLVLREALPAAQAKLARQGFVGTLVIFKNNVDSAGNTFGCHENYLMQRDSFLLAGEPFLRYLIRALVPFLVTRPIFCGTGSVLAGKPGGRARFIIYQRGPFIESLVSKETLKDRAILNLGREGESLAPPGFRRLHLILGDATVSGWGTWMKLGTTGLVVRMIEDLFAPDLPVLKDPITALHAVASDVSLSATVELRDDYRLTATELQWRYYEAALDYLERWGATADEEAVLDQWYQALSDLEKDASRMRNRTDWVLKKSLLDQVLQSAGLSWQDPLPSDVTRNLQGVDFRYHDISADGAFSRLYPVDTMLAAPELEKAKTAPPWTRAMVRGLCIAGLQRGTVAAKVEKWTILDAQGTTIEISDPLQFAHPEIEASCSVSQLGAALRQPDPAIRRRAAVYVAWLRTDSALQLLVTALAAESEDPVRRAIVESVGEWGDKAIPFLQKWLRHESVAVQWAAEETLDRIANGRIGKPRAGATAAGPASETVLVDLIR